MKLAFRNDFWCSSNNHHEFLINQQSIIRMKSLKTVIKRASSPKTSNPNPLHPLSSQRSKANSKQIFQKYNHHTPIDLSKQTLIPNKYRIVTEPIDDHMLQLSKSYAKLSNPKKKQIKFQSQHNSIKSRQKTVSNEKYAPTLFSICPNCQIYEREMALVRQEIKRMVNLKEKWKNGQIIVEDFISDSEKYKNSGLTKQAFIDSLQEVRFNFIDLMKDIEVLTEVDYPKLLSHNIFNSEQSLNSTQDQAELKVLLYQLRQQTQGKLSLLDLDLQTDDQNFKVIIRNLKTNLMHTIRENLQLRTLHYLPRKQGIGLRQQIRRVVGEVLKGLRK